MRTRLWSQWTILLFPWILFTSLGFLALASSTHCTKNAWMQLGVKLILSKHALTCNLEKLHLVQNGDCPPSGSLFEQPGVALLYG